jgi:hypothetical protein
MVVHDFDAYGVPAGAESDCREPRARRDGTSAVPSLPVQAPEIPVNALRADLPRTFCESIRAMRC